MSSNIKLAKKKYTQNDLRRLMQEQKTKSNKHANSNASSSEQKIDSPLAKYDEKGSLSCILCKSLVRSESVWKVHINSKNHKEKVEMAKHIRERLDQQNQATKRANETSIKSSNEKKLRIDQNLVAVETEKRVPGDFFDHTPKKISNESMMETDGKVDNTLPEGFFDDPKKDAIVRNIDYKNPQEEEWLKFQKEIKDETSVSLEIIAGEVESSTNEREIQDIDEQMYNWQRVLNMEKKKEDISEKLKSSTHVTKMDYSSESSDDKSEDGFDEFLDWRAKQIVKK